MPASKSPYKYILVLLCDTSNFLVATPMKKATAEEVCSILFDNFKAYYAVPMRIICDQDPTFMSSLCQWFFKAYGMAQLVTYNTYNTPTLDNLNPFELALDRKHTSYPCYRYIFQSKANLGAKADVLKRKTSKVQG